MAPRTMIITCAVTGAVHAFGVRSVAVPRFAG